MPRYRVEVRYDRREYSTVTRYFDVTADSPEDAEENYADGEENADCEYGDCDDSDDEDRHHPTLCDDCACEVEGCNAPHMVDKAHCQAHTPVASTPDPNRVPLPAVDNVCPTCGHIDGHWCHCPRRTV